MRGKCWVRGCAGELGESCFFLVSKGEGLCGLGETRDWLRVDEREMKEGTGEVVAEGQGLFGWFRKKKKNVKGGGRLP